MTMTADVNVPPPADGAGLAGLVDDDLIARLAGRARAHGVSLVGEGGLLRQLTKRVLEAARWRMRWTGISGRGNMSVGPYVGQCA